VERTEKFTEEVIQKASTICRDNPGIKKEEIVFRLKQEMGLTGRTEDAKLYAAWQLGPDTLHRLLVKIVEIVLLLEDSSRRLAGRRRSIK